MAGFPGAALLLGRGVAPAAANPRGAALLAEVDDGTRAALRTFADETLTAGAARVVALAALPGGEALLLPFADGACVLALLRDPALESSSHESHRRYRDLVEMARDFAWETDEAGRFTFVSPKGVLGWLPDALLGHAGAEFLTEPGEENVFAALLPVADVEVGFRRADGGSARLAITATPLVDAAGNPRGVRGIGHDLTAAREREDALAQAHLRDSLLTHIVRAIRHELDPEAALAAAVTATGLALGAAGGVVLRRIDGAMAPAASWGEMPGTALLDAARAALATEDTILLGSNDWRLIGQAARYRQAVEGAVLVWRRGVDGSFPETDRSLLADVADQLGVVIAQVAQHERILSLSRTDPLTELMNRRAFFEELERRLRRLERSARSAVLLAIDLDNFKLVNDRRGHRTGDEAIRALCDMLRAHSRGGDLVARLGGDEFALWIEGLGARGAKERAEALLRAARALEQFSGDPAHPLGISVGLALVEPPLGETPEQLMARADAAMNDAKAQGKGRIVIAAPAGAVPA